MAQKGSCQGPGSRRYGSRATRSGSGEGRNGVPGRARDSISGDSERDRKVPRCGGGSWSGAQGESRAVKASLAFEGEVASGGGEACKRGFMNDDGEREVGAGRIVRRRELGPGETGVFGKGRIPDVVIDFDGPVAAVVGEELPRGRAVSGRRGDAIDLLAGGLSGSVLPGVGAAACDAEDLGDVGVVQEALQGGHDLDGPLLDAPMGQVDLCLEAPGRVALPMDGREQFVGLGRVFLDGHEIVGTVGLGR